MNKFVFSRRIGFTLIELLVSITILGVLLVLLVPQIRTVTQERNIRESARVVGGMFSQASQRAVADGVAGVILFRNPNFVDGAQQYAVTEMALLRKVPDYTGDQAADGTILTGAMGNTGLVRILAPIEQVALELVKPGDKISFNYSSTEYPITAVTQSTDTVMLGGGPQTLNFVDLALDLGGAAGQGTPYLPDPSGFLPAFMSGGAPVAGAPFKVHRLPREVRSSRTTLPPGLLVDTRFSGFSALDSGGVPRVSATFEPTPATILGGATFGLTNSSLMVLFNGSGQFDRLVISRKVDSDGDGDTDSADLSSGYTRLATEPLYCFVSKLELDANINPLARDSNLWVSVSNSSSAINIGYNNAIPASAASVADMNTGASIAATDMQRNQFNAIINASRNSVASDLIAQ